jgi:hypothetical protein
MWSHGPITVEIVEEHFVPPVWVFAAGTDHTVWL